VCVCVKERERERERDLGVGGYREKLIKLEEKGKSLELNLKASLIGRTSYGKRFSFI